jgi:hypothetical protein
MVFGTARREVERKRCKALSCKAFDQFYLLIHNCCEYRRPSLKAEIIYIPWVIFPGERFLPMALLTFWPVME